MNLNTNQLSGIASIKSMQGNPVTGIDVSHSHRYFLLNQIGDGIRIVA